MELLCAKWSKGLRTAVMPFLCTALLPRAVMVVLVAACVRTHPPVAGLFRAEGHSSGLSWRNWASTPNCCVKIAKLQLKLRRHRLNRAWRRVDLAELSSVDVRREGGPFRVRQHDMAATQTMLAPSEPMTQITATGVPRVGGQYSGIPPEVSFIPANAHDHAVFGRWQAGRRATTHFGSVCFFGRHGCLRALAERAF
jgi:hypothetical protein